MAFDLVSSSFTKEEWLDDVEIQCKIEEEDEKKSDTVLNVYTKGEASGVVKFDAIGEFSKKEEVKLEQVEPKDEPLCCSAKLDDGTIALDESTLDPLGKEMPYFCHACGFVSNSSGTLLYHVNREIGDPGGNVHYGYDVNSISTQAKAHKVHKPHACDHCDFTSTVFRDMKKHKKIHLTSFACDECDFKTTSKKSLASHKNIHFPDRRFACGICSYKTRDRDCLKNHMMNHAKKLCPAEEKGPADPRFLGLKCRQCDHVATSINGLNKHVDSHRSDVAALGGAASNIPSGLECDQCDFKGTHERGLTSHYNLKHKNILCQYCRLPCADRKALNRHIVDAHNAKPSYLVQLKKSSRIACKATKKEVFCNLCGNKYSRQWFLDKHMKKIHNAIIMQPQKRPKMSRPAKLLMLTGNGLLD